MHANGWARDRPTCCCCILPHHRQPPHPTWFTRPRVFAELKPPQPAGVPVPPLPSGEKPNFIVILTDDQGWDDVGLHYPQKPGAPAFVNTPHLDAFMRAGTQFDNFYVTPLCAQTRAALLTGRDNPRTGTLLISGGYDFMSRDEVNMAEFFAAAGYKTAHFGKVHVCVHVQCAYLCFGANESGTTGRRRVLCITLFQACRRACVLLL